MASTVQTLQDAGLLGVGEGPAAGYGSPTCSADLVSGQVACYQLNGGTFSVTRNGDSATTQTLAVRSNPQGGGYVVNYGSAFLSGLVAGDTVTLTETGVSRSLSTLHVYPLRVDLSQSGNFTGGTCQPSKSMGPGYGGYELLPDLWDDAVELRGVRRPQRRRDDG